LTLNALPQLFISNIDIMNLDYFKLTKSQMGKIVGGDSPIHCFCKFTEYNAQTQTERHIVRKFLRIYDEGDCASACTRVCMYNLANSDCHLV
jgi:hypothetical protein